MSKKISQWVAEAKVDPVGAYRRRKVHCDRLASGGHGGRRAGKSHMRDFLKACQAAGIDMTEVRAQSQAGQGAKTGHYIAFVTPQRSASSAATWSSDPGRLQQEMVSFVQAIFPDINKPMATVARARTARVESKPPRVFERVDYAPFARAIIFHQLNDVEAKKLKDNPLIKLVPDHRVKIKSNSSIDQASGLQLKKDLVAPSDKKIGVIDSGIDIRHPEFKGVEVTYMAFKRGRRDPRDARDFGDHGTHVCSLIAGKSCGYAPGSKLVVAAVLRYKGGSEGYLTDVVAGFNWTVAQMPYAINMSLQFDRSFDDLREPIQSYTRGELGGASGFAVAACGNKETSPEPGAPGCYPDTIAVGAEHADGRQWDGTAIGLDCGGGSVSKPDVWCYGVAVMGAVPGGKYAEMTGTSMASAIHTALLANGKATPPDQFTRPTALS
ncbi:MAG: S8 family serine peptidase [Alphaproteobacteria bacterium]|nr:S8 family serine peptidase [Alphaproteobacteria bacterium]